VKKKSVKTLDATSLGDLFDRRQAIARAYYQIRSAGVPHQRKTIEAMRRGDERACRLTQDGKSCECRDAKLSVYAHQLRDIESAIGPHLNPIVPNLAFAQRDRLCMQASELKERARQLRIAAEEQVRGLRIEAQQLDARADALREQSKSDAERAIEALRAEGGSFYEEADGAHRITVADRTALVSHGAAGCCLELFYEHVSDPSYAPREGDQIACHTTCWGSGVASGFVFAGGRWRGWRQESYRP
jgi:hypothetical protein